MTTWEELLEQNRKQHRRRSPRHEESKLQASCVKWFRYQYRDSIIFAIPNGGKRTQREAEIMKAEGVLAGVADLEILAGDGRVLFIEMKTDEGRQSKAQRDFQKWCDEHCFIYMVTRSLEQFIEVVEAFMGE